jgi:hypothetical protein
MKKNTSLQTNWRKSLKMTMVKRRDDLIFRVDILFEIPIFNQNNLKKIKILKFPYTKGRGNHKNLSMKKLRC